MCPTRVAFHAINGVGLGHVVRVSSLAVEIRAILPDAELLVITNAGDTSLLESRGLDFVAFPPRVTEPHADPGRATRALPDALEEAAILAALRAFGADLVVFDTHAPMKVVRELPSLGARAVLVLRELRPEAMRSLISSDALRWFDRVIVPHEPDEVDASELARVAPTVVVGPIAREIPGGRSAPRPNTVVAMAGGGGQPLDARRYARAVVDAHILARARIADLTTTLVVGPYGHTPPHAESVDGLTVKKAHPDPTLLMRDAALVISQAGYNAIAELRALEKPAVLVPGYRKAEDQRERAKRLESVGAAVIARPEARSIADRIERLLLDDPRALARMADAHRARPLIPKNRDAAIEVLRPIRRPPGRVRRVAIVAHDFAPKIGGMESVARSLFTALSDRDDVEARVYTARRLGARETFGERASAISPVFEPLPPPARIALFDDLLTTIALALRDLPDVIHLCHAGLGPWIPALRAALPAIVTANVHGNDLLAPWVRHDMPSDDAYRQALVDGLSAADAVFCVSAFSRALAADRGVLASKLLTVENGVDRGRFASLPVDGARASDLARRLGVTDRDEVILTVSRLVPRKGHRTVIRALAKLARSRPRLKYLFTGASATMRAELMALARELGVADRVVPVGFVADDELAPLYALADVFALVADGDASDVEGFGVALLEAALAGLPTVASRAGGMPEAISDRETGLLVSPGDADDVARTLGELFASPALRATLGERGRARVEDRFTHERVAARMLDTWSALADLPRSTTTAPARYAPEHVGRGAEIARAGGHHAARSREDRAARRAAIERAVTRDHLVRVRATGDGARLLPDVLEDCAALGHKPAVEVKLRRFLDSDFSTWALPRIAEVDLVHGVPSADPDALFAALAASPTDALQRVRNARIYLTPEARANGILAISAVPEAHRLRRFFSEHAVTVVPPPELMRYLSDVPAGAPETGMIEPTNLCNLGCPTCPTGTGKIKPLPQMTISRFDRILDELAPFKSGRLRNLALWNYGEPLLNKELPAMIAHAKSAGIGVVKVSSNVHFLDGERGRALLASGLDVLILSVDGASQETYEKFRRDGDFDKVARSVAWLCDEKKKMGLKKPRIELQFIVMRHNEHELPEIRRLAREWGVDKLRIKTVGAEDDDTKSLVPTSRLLSRYQADNTTPSVRHAFCTMAWDHTVVNVDGSITPCCYLRPDMGDAFVMGNIFEAPFAEIWRGERYRAFREAMLGGRHDMPICGRCRGGTHDLVHSIEEVREPPHERVTSADRLEEMSP